MTRRFVAPAVLGALLAGMTGTPAQAAPAWPAWLTVCLSRSSIAPDTLRYDVPAGVQLTDVWYTPNVWVEAGRCADGWNPLGELRVSITSESGGASYQQGEDGKGWHRCVNVVNGVAFSNPVNNPPGGIVRYRTFPKRGCKR